jgi:HlyD family secretion protein
MPACPAELGGHSPVRRRMPAWGFSLRPNGTRIFEAANMNSQGGTIPLAQQPNTAAPKTAGARVPARGRRLLVALGLFLLVPGTILVWLYVHERPAVRYVTAPVTRGSITRTVTATGTVNPELTVMVGSYVSGAIKQLYCDYGTKVKAGQLCAKIDPRPYQTAVDQARANLAVAKAQLEKDEANLAYTQLNYERKRWLSEQGTGARETADAARNAYGQAQAQTGLDRANIELHQAALAAAQVNLDYTDIVSPLDGTVVSRNVTQGQTVAASFQTPTLFLIATSLDKMQVDTNVSESDIGGVKEGEDVTFTVDAFPGRIFQGSVMQVRQSPQTVQNVVTYDVIVSADNGDLALRPGMTATAQIVTGRRNDVVRVPNQALRYLPGGVPRTASLQNAALAGVHVRETPRVWVLRDGKPAAIPVVPGLDDESLTEAGVGSLQPGTLVIIGEGANAQ